MTVAATLLFAIDAGNTRIKWGVHDGARWSALGAGATEDAADLGAQWPALPGVPVAIASNVAGAAVAAELVRQCGARGWSLRTIASVAAQRGVANGYRDASQLGTDRWASLIGAHAMSAVNQLVVNAGTALTIDALTIDGRFLGGLIVPGPALMRRALDGGTAALRLTEGEFRPFPASTPEAITTGSIQACVGAIERMAAAMAAHGAAPSRIVLSGGGATELRAHLSLPVAFNENLVLDGLLHIARDR